MAESPYEEEVTAELKPWWLASAENRYQWVLIQPCGCCTSVLEGEYAKNWLEALCEFYDDEPARAQGDLERGIQVKRIPHEEYVERYRQHMRPEYKCSHYEPRTFWGRFLDVLLGKP